jgi:hypothetical protein
VVLIEKIMAGQNPENLPQPDLLSIDKVKLELKPIVRKTAAAHSFLTFRYEQLDLYPIFP